MHRGFLKKLVLIAFDFEKDHFLTGRKVKGQIHENINSENDGIFCLGLQLHKKKVISCPIETIRVALVIEICSRFACRTDKLSI